MKTIIALLISVSMIAPAHAWYPPVVVVKPPPPVAGAGTSGATGAAMVGGFLVFVGILAGYDIVRRWTCIGDPWRLGGPGFTEANRPLDNVKSPPVCNVGKRHRRAPMTGARP